MFVEVFGNTNRDLSDFENDHSMENLSIYLILKRCTIEKAFVY